MTQESGRFSTDKPTGGTPLQEFWGNLKEIKTINNKDEQSGRTWQTAQFDFTDVEVIRATEPYPYPTASIFVGYSDPHNFRTSKENRWEALAASVRGFGVDLYDLVGKRQRWDMVPSNIRAGLVDEEGNQILETEGKYAGKQKWGTVTQDCWTVAEIQGMSKDSGGDILDYIAELLDGKTEDDFYSALFQDAKARTHSNIIEQATQRQLLPSLAATGVAHRDEAGVWHKGNGNGSSPEPA